LTGFENPIKIKYYIMKKRTKKSNNTNIIKGNWQVSEDELLIKLVKQYGPKKWSEISLNLPGRIGKNIINLR
jgi:myb proto-oncogene protein